MVIIITFKIAITHSNFSGDLGFMTGPELLNVATSRQLMKPIIVRDAAETLPDGCRTSGSIYNFIAPIIHLDDSAILGSQIPFSVPRQLHDDHAF